MRTAAVVVLVSLSLFACSSSSGSRPAPQGCEQSPIDNPDDPKCVADYVCPALEGAAPEVGCSPVDGTNNIEWCCPEWFRD